VRRSHRRNRTPTALPRTPDPQQNTRPDLISIRDVDGTSGLLDVADALGFVEIQQQEVTVEPVVNGDEDRHEV
jgi:hypothetical protein